MINVLTKSKIESPEDKTEEYRNVVKEIKGRKHWTTANRY